MQYVSTRGEASSLGFIEVMLAGLARDGGLHVPEAWPRLDPGTIAGFAGRPYAEIEQLPGASLFVHDSRLLALAGVISNVLEAGNEQR